MRKPLSPLQAFAEDVRHAEVRQVELGDEPLRWMSIVQTAELLSATNVAERPAALAEAAAAESLAAYVAQRPSMVHDVLPEPTEALGRVAELLRSAAEDMERSGCFELAYATVSAVCRLTASADYVSASLATLHLGRVARQMNEYAVAKDCYDAMLSTTSRERDGPLTARGHIGLALLHDMKGNLPAAEGEYRKALRLAVHMGGAYAQASQGLMSIALTRGQLADALLHGWNVYDASELDVETRAGVLSDLAGVALSAGFAEPALQGYRFASQLCVVPRLHMIIAAGVLRSAARLGDRELVSRFDLRLLDDIARANQPFSASMTLLYAAEAWAMLFEMPIARKRLEQSIALSKQFGYAEYLYRADALSASWDDNEATLSLATSRPYASRIAPTVRPTPVLIRGIDRLRTVGV